MAYQQKQDLDAFLTSLESKLRGPYSSLELSKIISTDSLRGSLSSQEYLQTISKVLPRTDKTTYLRTIVGLLGLEPGKETDEEVYKILSDAQVSTNEDWVRVVAGLARGILFVDEDGDSRESCRGEEANSLLDRTCREIVEQTRQLEKDTELSLTETNGKNSLQTTDMYPLFVSYRYSLLDPKLLDRVIPEHKENPYFSYDESVSILHVDDKLETAKAEESQDHNVISTTKQVTSTPAATESKKPEATAILPGMNTTKKVIPKAVTNRPKASMFLPAKRPGAVPGRGGLQIPTKGTLHTRRAGAAQALLGKNRRAVVGGPTASLARSAQMGRAQKLANAKSKMKMIDVTEVRGLTNQHKQREDKLAKNESKEQKLQARKRKIMEAAAEKGLVVVPKLRKSEEETPEEEKDDEQPSAVDMIKNTNTGTGFMAFGDADDDDDDDDEDGNEDGGDNEAGSSNEEWQEILKERSNKLSEEDRSRVQQFFAQRYNPTPDQRIYKMKLHEERITDPATGQAMKETYYLELDYSTFTSKQSKKTKRY